MPVILIVDDSHVDRRVAGGLLEKDADLSVEYADDGVDALAKMESAAPDVVLTDLIMPNMGGLELVAEIRRKYPLIPSVLMTSMGNEETAVKALRHGASSYVPKHTLAEDLLETIHNVLEVARRERGYSRLMDFMTRHEFTFELMNDRSLIAPLVTFLQEGVSRLGICGEADQMRLGIALDEALVNAIYHGNLEVHSDLREGDGEAYHELVRRRSEEIPYRNRRIHVQAKLSSREAVFVIRDEGPGFDPSELPDPTDPANLEKVSGRGVLLMRTFMDEVVFNDQGNCVQMIKRRDPNDEPSRGTPAR